jgi:hypothetical protein
VEHSAAVSLPCPGVETLAWQEVLLLNPTPPAAGHESASLAKPGLGQPAQGAQPTANAGGSLEGSPSAAH